MVTDNISTIFTALEQTLAAGAARITWSTEWSIASRPARERGPVSTAALGVAKAAGKAVGGPLLGLAFRGYDPLHPHGEGVLDLVGRRWMVDYHSHAVLHVGTQEWSGRSGRPLDTLDVATPRIPSPLWLFDLVAGVNGAEDHGTEEVDGPRWRHLLATADLAEASARRPEGMASPARNRYEDLLAPPIEVWLDDGHLRRLRFVGELGTDTLTLTEFGIPAEGLDWSRLPSNSSEPPC